VIGSGPGGAITACLLAEAGRDVVLIEDGPFLPLESCPPFTREEMVQKYRNGGITTTLGAARIAYVEGRCVGGGSEINSGLYHRTPPRILEEWTRDFQVEAIGEAEITPHFEAFEKELSVSMLDGPAPAASLKLHQGAAALGWKSVEVPRWFRHGKKQSMTQTFLPRFLNAGGRVFPNVRARRLVRSGDRWSVYGEHRDEQSSVRHVRIDAETVFAAGGAVQTPALLRRSGIRRNIGNTLQMHPTVKIVAEFADEVNTPQMGVPVHQVKEFAPRISFGCSISSPPHLALALLHYPEARRQLDQDWRRMAVYYAMIRGGQGTVRTLPRLGGPDRSPAQPWSLSAGSGRPDPLPSNIRLFSSARPGYHTVLALESGVNRSHDHSPFLVVPDGRKPPTLRRGFLRPGPRREESVHCRCLVIVYGARRESPGFDHGDRPPERTEVSGSTLRRTP
jgi:hypothetical protein